MTGKNNGNKTDRVTHSARPAPPLSRNGGSSPAPESDRQKWFTDGATMEYPPLGRTLYWLINLLLFGLLNLFYLRLRTGSFWPFAGPYESQFFIPELLAPLNIFQFPTYILVIALITALLCTVPILIAQLYNLLFSLPFILMVFFLGHNPILSLCLFVSCAMAGFRPLRFKSKFVAALVCLIPELLYCILFSGENPQQDILRWAVLYSPWALAFLFGIVIFAIVLSIGHFLRYRPGILMPLFALLLAGTVAFFNHSIGMTERDFQDQVSRFNPAKIPEFQNRSIVPLLEEERARRLEREPYLNPEVVMSRLRMEWRWAYRIGTAPDMSVIMDSGPVTNPISLANREVTRFYQAKLNAVDQIDKFIRRYPHEKRVADALYYKALIIDLNVDLRALRNEDTLQFYLNFPSADSRNVWQEILSRFPDSDVAIEARWRLARLQAAKQSSDPSGTDSFGQALKLLDEASQLCKTRLEDRKKSSEKPGFWFSRLGTVFTPVEKTITDQRLTSLQKRIAEWMLRLGSDNRTGLPQHEERLAAFAALNPYQLSYEEQLKALQFSATQPDPLLDNIELALALLLPDPQQKIQRLTDLITLYPQSDGAIEARLELALALLDQKNRSEYPGDRQVLLTSSREYLQQIVALRPDTFWADFARTLLQNNPVE